MLDMFTTNHEGFFIPIKGHRIALSVDSKHSDHEKALNSPRDRFFPLTTPPEEELLTNNTTD